MSPESLLAACAAVALVCAAVGARVVVRARANLLRRVRAVDGRIATLELRAARAHGVRLAETCAKLRAVGFTLPAEFFE